MKKESLEQIKNKLTEINSIVKDYEPQIRAGAFSILAKHFFEVGDPKEQKNQPGGKPGGAGSVGDTGKSENPHDLSEFVRSFDHSKAKDNLHAIVAWYYAQYGLIPITTKMITKAGAEAAVTIPDRPDITMKVSGIKGGQKYYKKMGKSFRLTVTGEKFVQKKYQVKKGNKQYTTAETKDK
jgi:hypothetical protein